MGVLRFSVHESVERLAYQYSIQPECSIAGLTLRPHLPCSVLRQLQFRSFCFAEIAGLACKLLHIALHVFWVIQYMLN